MRSPSRSQVDMEPIRMICGLDPNFRDMEESPYLRLERLTRAIPYFAWSNYLTISH